MILVFEMTWSGPVHAPGNSATIQTMAQAYPREEIRVFAAASHIAELRSDAALTAHANVTFLPIAVYPHLFGKTHIVSWGRFRQEFATCAGSGHGSSERALPGHADLGDADCDPGRAMVRQDGAGTARPSACRLGCTAISMTSTAGGRAIRCRAPSTCVPRLSARYPPVFSFLVLEEGIRLALAEDIPAIADRVQVLPLPINLTELPGQRSRSNCDRRCASDWWVRRRARKGSICSWTSHGISRRATAAWWNSCWSAGPPRTAICRRSVSWRIRSRPMCCRATVSREARQAALCAASSAGPVLQIIGQRCVAGRDHLAEACRCDAAADRRGAVPTVRRPGLCL